MPSGREEESQWRNSRVGGTERWGDRNWRNQFASIIKERNSRDYVD